jgi:hypothetical protein
LSLDPTTVLNRLREPVIPTRDAQFGFIAVRSRLGYRTEDRGGRPRVEFRWQGDDEGDDVCGRGWATPTDDGTLDGHLFFHLGDDSGFHAVPFDPSAGRGRSMSEYQYYEFLALDRPVELVAIGFGDPQGQRS